MKNRSKHGFTLVEVSASVLVVTAALGLALGGFMYMLKKTNEGDIQNDLNINVQMAMERLKKDLRLSSLDEIFYYPQGPGPYTAISFPLPQYDNNDRVKLTTKGKVMWGKTIIYHIWPGSPHQLKVTTFANRIKLSAKKRRAQLKSVVNEGDGTHTHNKNNASSTILFENLLDLVIRPNKGVIDTYSPILKHERVNLGYALLSEGSHTFKFIVAGKNANASGYQIGIDQLNISSANSPREAESLLPVIAESGATAISQYMDGSWQGNHQLHFPSTAIGHYFTLSMDNTQWVETNFGVPGYTASNSVTFFDETFSPKDMVLQLDGMNTTWDVSKQTGDKNGSDPTGSMANWAIRVMQKGSEMADNGSWFEYNGRKCRVTFEAAGSGSLKIVNAFMGESADSEEANMDFLAEVQTIKFGGSLSATIPAGGTATSDWIDLPIDKAKTYLVSFRIANSTALGSPRQWQDLRTVGTNSTMTTTIVESAGKTIAKDKSWSDRTDITPYSTNYFFGLKSIEASYPEGGTYTSHIFDTRLAAPTYEDITVNADIPVGTVLTTKVRSGNQYDLSDASDWSLISASAVSPRNANTAYKRYIQFQAQLTSSSDGLFTPKIKDITIDWTGEPQLANVSGEFTKGPKCGIIEVLIDDVSVQSSLSIDLTIYKTNIMGLNKTKKRVTSSLTADIQPRNTGK